MLKSYLAIGTVVLTIASIAFALHFFYFKPALETITFFPLDQSAQYQSANTTLTLQKDHAGQKHRVDWSVSSVLDQDAYLRQDMALVFSNGRLKGKMAKWRQDTSLLTQKDVLSADESAKYEGITFHYSELHHSDDQITSTQRMSEDFLYVIHSPFSPLSSFRMPKSNLEREWQEVLDQSTENRLAKSLQKAIDIYGINEEDYMTVPLIGLRKFEDQPIDGFNQTETANLIGRLWEGLYKNYFQGIKKSDGTVEDPIDSTMPVILISKDKSHLLAVIQTKSGESIILKQLLQGSG